MKRKHIITLKFTFTMLLVYGGNSLNYTLMIPYLEDLGFSEFSQGWLFTVAAVFTILGQFIFGYFCDKLKSNKKVFYMISVCYIAFTWLFYSKSDNSMALVVLWAGFLLACASAVEGILDSWVIESDPYCLKNYGLIRAFAALGWALGALAVAYFVVNWGYASLGTAFCFLTLISLTYALIIPDANKVETGSKLSLKDTKVFLYNKDFVFLCGVLFFIYLAGNADHFTTTFKLMSLGATEENLSFLMFARALYEFPFFFIGGWLNRKLKAKRALTLVCIVYIMRYIAYSQANTVLQLIASAIILSFAFPLLMIATKQLVDQVSPRHLRTSGQQIAVAVYGGCSGLIAPVLCGTLIRYFSYNITLYLMALGCIIPLVLLRLFKISHPEEELNLS